VSLLLQMGPTSLPAAAELDASALIQRLAKPAPATIDFTEVRFSTLLKQPLIVSGTLGYAGPANLDRHVTRPYREDTEIRGESVRVIREGEPVRSFALKRAPELGGLLRAFTALLAGDHEAVGREFEIAPGGDENLWKLVLTPRDARVRKRVPSILINGRKDLPRCFTIVNDNGGASVMLLGGASQRELQQPLTREWLERYCASGE
jgi:hypothetical protein